MAKKRLLFRLISLVLLVSLFAATLSSCERDAKVKNRIFYEYFDTVVVVYDYSGGSQRDFDKVCDRIEELIAEYNRLYDIYNEYEGIINIATLNRNAGGEALTVDEKIIDLLDFSLDIYSLTDGNVNVAMGSVLSLWHDLRTEGVRIPSKEELRSRAEHTDPEKLIVDRENCTVRLSDPQMSLDVGAVAKGYVAERVSEILREEGIGGYALDFGGNLCFVGTKPDGSAWASAIRNPDRDSEEKYVRRLQMSDGALVTSGVYERFYTVDGVNYHHIINKETLMPENYYLSVSVATSSSALADALSTAIFNMKIDEARAFVLSLSDVEATLVLADGEVVVCGEAQCVKKVEN